MSILHGEGNFSNVTLSQQLVTKVLDAEVLRTNLVTTDKLYIDELIVTTTQSSQTQVITQGPLSGTGTPSDPLQFNGTPGQFLTQGGTVAVPPSDLFFDVRWTPSPGIFTTYLGFRSTGPFLSQGQVTNYAQVMSNINPIKHVLLIAQRQFSFAFPVNSTNLTITLDIRTPDNTLSYGGTSTQMVLNSLANNNEYSSGYALFTFTNPLPANTPFIIQMQRPRVVGDNAGTLLRYTAIGY